MKLGAVELAVGLTGGGGIVLPGVYAAGWVVCGYGSGVYVPPWVAGARNCCPGFLPSSTALFLATTVLSVFSPCTRIDSPTPWCIVHGAPMPRCVYAEYAATGLASMSAVVVERGTEAALYGMVEGCDCGCGGACGGQSLRCGGVVGSCLMRDVDMGEAPVRQLSGVGAGGRVACSCGGGSVGGWILPPWWCAKVAWWAW